MLLTSRSNPIVKEIAALKEKKGRREFGAFLVEGEKMVRESLSSPLPRRYTVISEDYAGATFGLDPIVVSRSVFAHLSDTQTPQGILSVLSVPNPELRAPSGCCLVLDGISDPGNMGTLIRTANAAGYRELYLMDCTDPFSPKSVRASMSGIFFTTLYRGKREQILPLLDLPLISADMSGENVFAFTPPARYALCIGNEANGLSKEVRAASDYTIAIPMDRTAESLNAAVSAGIAMYALKYHS